MGADFIKVYSRLPRDVYLAIAEESRTRGIPFAGHVPAEVTAEEASDAGQKSFEHLIGVDLALSRARPAIQDMYANASTNADFAAIQARHRRDA